MKKLLVEIINFIKFIIDIMIHHIEYAILAGVAIIIVYISRKYVEKINLYLNKMLDFIEKFIMRKKIEKTIKKYEDNISKDQRIKQDIDSHIKLLTNNEKRFVAIQFLLLHPSPRGLKAILDLAVSCNSREIREDLICSICDCVKKNGWHNDV